MGLGVDRTTAKTVAFAKLKALQIGGDGLIARTLQNNVAS
jgi:hypothetical protein